MTSESDQYDEEMRLPMLPWCRECWDQIGEPDTRPPDSCPDCGSSETFLI
jgi:Zn finger protein HypA/HybF involved in hydrogenase expression